MQSAISRMIGIAGILIWLTLSVSCQFQGIQALFSPKKIKSNVWNHSERLGESLEYYWSDLGQSYTVRLKTNSTLVHARILTLGLSVVFRNSQNLTQINYPVGCLELRNFNSKQALLDYWKQTKSSEIWKTRLMRNRNIVYVQGLEEYEGFVHKDSLDEVRLSFEGRSKTFSFELEIPKTILETQEEPSYLGIVLGKIELDEQPQLSSTSRKSPSPLFLLLCEDWEIWKTI